MRYLKIVKDKQTKFTHLFFNNKRSERFFGTDTIKLVYKRVIRKYKLAYERLVQMKYDKECLLDFYEL